MNRPEIEASLNNYQYLIWGPHNKQFLEEFVRNLGENYILDQVSWSSSVMWVHVYDFKSTNRNIEAIGYSMQLWYDFIDEVTEATHD